MPPRRWTTEELAIAKNMLVEGVSFNDIGKKIDRSAAAVEAKLKGKNNPNNSGSTGSASTSNPKSQSSPTAESAPIAQETPRAAPKSAPPSETTDTEAPQSFPAANDAIERESSTMKYIIGAVIIAVILWIVIG